MLRIGLIGNGAIARQVIAAAQTPDAGFTVVGALDRVDSSVPGGPPVVLALDDLLKLHPDFVVEAASHEAIRAHAAGVLESGRDLMIVSIGALADAALFDQVKAAAARTGRRVLLPPGAVGGIDAIAAAREFGLSEVRLTTRKPPLSWGGAPGVEGIDLGAIAEPRAIFEGNARAAAFAFPKNANVAATVALAGLGFEATAIRLVADPTVSENIHRIEARGSFGELAIELRNLPSPDNPKTSALTGMSIVRLIKAQAGGILI